MSMRKIPPRELNVFSGLHRFLVENWRNLLDPEEKPALIRELIEQLIVALKEQNNNICQKTQRMLYNIEEAYKCAKYEIISFEAKLEERGLFGGSQCFGTLVFEVGLEFDPYLNVPLIPGSSVKGAVRSAWRTLFGDKEERAENLIFGGLNSSGACVFHDGYPIKIGRNGYLLYPDILTPHYLRGGKDILREHEAEPSPVVYLTVAPETVFKFIVAMPKRFDEDLRRKLKEAFFEALKLGIGGKTNIGYSRFRVENLRLSYGGV
ncbi:MAG: type III-B CRISPR module RAMP protein Cmr6 [Thermoproteota archaeon]